MIYKSLWKVLASLKLIPHCPLRSLHNLLYHDKSKRLEDRIYVESMGILLPGMTIEDMKQGISRIRNSVIARVFKELHLIEQWGTGVPRIFSEASEMGLPEPMIEEIGMRFRFSVFLGKAHKSHTQITEQVEAQVEAQVGLSVLRSCAKKPLSSREIASILGHKTLSGNLRKVLPKFRETGLLEYTIPDKPKSRLQRYRLTEKGKEMI